MSQKPTSEVEAVVAAEGAFRQVAKILDRRAQVSRRRDELLDQARELASQVRALEGELATIDAALDGPAKGISEAMAARRAP